MLQGIFFDLDDTLIGYSEAEHHALSLGCRVASARYPHIPETALAAAIYDIYTSRYDYGTPGFAELGTLSVIELRRRLTQEALEVFGVEDPELVEEQLRVYTEAEREALRPFPDVRETLARLRPYFYLGVITNGPSAVQREKLAAMALEGAFDAIIVDTEFGHSKPDRRIFDYAAAKAGRSSDQLLFVGNSLSADVAGSKTAGWISVWLNLEGAAIAPEEPQPDYVVQGFAEVASLPPVVEAIGANVGIGGRSPEKKV